MLCPILALTTTTQKLSFDTTPKDFYHQSVVWRTVVRVSTSSSWMFFCTCERNLSEMDRTLERFQIQIWMVFKPPPPSIDDDDDRWTVNNNYGLSLNQGSGHSLNCPHHCRHEVINMWIHSFQWITAQVPLHSPITTWYSHMRNPNPNMDRFTDKKGQWTNHPGAANRLFCSCFGDVPGWQ